MSSQHHLGAFSGSGSGTARSSSAGGGTGNNNNNAGPSTSSSTSTLAHQQSGHQSSRSRSCCTSSSSGDIDLTSLLSSQLSSLCMSDTYADIVFLVDGQRLPAHRIILAARSDYFRAMLYGGSFRESTQNEIPLECPSAEAFRTLLRYIYSGHVQLGRLPVELVLDVFGLTHQYGFGALELAIGEFLRGVLAIENVCAILDAACLYQLGELQEVCLTFMDQNAVQLLQAEGFRQLSQQALCALLKRDSFFAPEVQIFAAVHEWAKVNGPAEDGAEAVAEVVGLVRLSLMNMEQLLKVVRPSGILPAERLLDVFEEKTTAKSLNYRGAVWPGENVASQKFGSQVVQGEFRSALLDDDCTSYDMEKGYTRHMITDANDQGIIVELGTISIINHLKLLLWDRDNRSYFYYVEVSVNLTQWERVVDHTEHNCRSWQFLYFPARAVKYVKLVGTHNTENKIFHAVSLQAMFAERPVPVVNGFVAPRYNVATVERSATVVRGVSRCRNVLINGDCTTYDWDSGYTCHQLGSGEILIQLGQPYWLSSMRILLWDCDDRSYSFWVETSTDMRVWEMAVDRRSQMLKSWQALAFTPRPVVFVKIVGTFNTANEIFHCVHFECPSQVEPPPVQPMDLPQAAKIVEGDGAGDELPPKSPKAVAAAAQIAAHAAAVLEPVADQAVVAPMAVVRPPLPPQQQQQQPPSPQQLREALAVVPIVAAAEVVEAAGLPPANEGDGDFHVESPAELA